MSPCALRRLPKTLPQSFHQGISLRLRPRDMTLQAIIKLRVWDIHKLFHIHVALNALCLIPFRNFMRDGRRCRIKSPRGSALTFCLCLALGRTRQDQTKHQQVNYFFHERFHAMLSRSGFMSRSVGQRTKRSKKDKAREADVSMKRYVDGPQRNLSPLIFVRRQDGLMKSLLF